MDATGYAQSVDDAINQTASIAGMSPAHWRAIASIESSLNPSSNLNRDTQYKGLYQIGSRGPQSEWATHGSGDIYNAMDNARAAASLAAANNVTFRQHFGRDPTAIETYMMHQQGPGFYTHGTMTNIAGNPYPGMSGPQTPQSFEAGWARELERRAGMFGGGQDPNAPASIAGTRSAPGSVGSMPAGARAGAAPSQQASAAPGQEQETPDLATAIGNVRDRISQAEQEQPAMQLQPMNFEMMVTPAMMRARLLAQAMRARDMGTGSTP